MVTRTPPLRLTTPIASLLMHPLNMKMRHQTPTLVFPSLTTPFFSKPPKISTTPGSSAVEDMAEFTMVKTEKSMYILISTLAIIDHNCRIFFVWLGQLPDGRQVAVKRLYEKSFRRMEQFRNEIQIFARLRHKNLVTLYGCTSTKSRLLVLVYEYICNGTVADHLHGKHAQTAFLEWPIRLSIALETAEALAYLHKYDGLLLLQLP